MRRRGYLAALQDWQVARAQLERAAGLLTPESALITRASKAMSMTERWKQRCAEEYRSYLLRILTDYLEFRWFVV